MRKELKSLALCFDRTPVAVQEPLQEAHSGRLPLGEPLTIRQAAQLIGCSAWTIRHRHMLRGLPHFRSGPSAKLIFYRDQVVAWILDQQKKGGQRREPF
jgi:hypothetical protein